MYQGDFPSGSSKEAACNAGAIGRVQSLSQEDPLVGDMATYSNILAGRIPMDRGAWGVTVPRVAWSRDTTEATQWAGTHHALEGMLSISPKVIKNLKDSIHWALFEEDQKESFPSTTHRNTDEKSCVPYICLFFNKQYILLTVSA